MARKSVERNIAYDDVKRKYYVTLQYGYDDRGKQIRKVKTFDRITNARKALRTHETACDSGTATQPTQITLTEWLDYWVVTVVKPNRAATTAYGYQQIIDNHIKPHLGSVQLQKVTPQKLQTYYAELLEDLSPNTVRKHHNLLRTALGVAVRQGMLSINPTDRVEAPKAKRPERKYYSAEDLARLIKAAQDDRLYPVILLAGILGLRREEICGLRWEHADFVNHRLHICNARTMASSRIVEKETKNVTSTRTLYMPPLLETALLELKEQQEKDREYLGDIYDASGYLIAWSDGRPYRPNYISELFSKFVREHDLPPLTLHGLRHTFATLANQSGVQMYDISKALGHSTMATTANIYTHLLDNTHQTTIERVATLFVTPEKAKAT